MKNQIEMTVANKSKLLVLILALVASMLSVNLASASMHHMDDSDCMMQTTCNNCFISAATPSSDLQISFSIIFKVWQIPNYFKDNQTTPPSPPPKK
jgi:hypothetical protein